MKQIEIVGEHIDVLLSMRPFGWHGGLSSSSLHSPQELMQHGTSCVVSGEEK